MATCYQKHPFEIETEDRLTSINSKIFAIKKKIQLSEGQRKSYYEENEAEKQQNNDLIETLKKEIKSRLIELATAREILGEDEIQIKKYLNNIAPMGKKNAEQIIHNLDLKVIEQRKALDLLKYERKAKKSKLKSLEKEYEHLLVEHGKSATEKIKSKNPSKKHASHLENEIHKVLVQWGEAEIVKKKYLTIRNALLDDSVKFESSLSQITELLKKQEEELAKLERVREEAAEMRMKATAALAAATAQTQDAEQTREAERAYFSKRFEERKKELEKLEKRIFPPASRPVVLRQDSSGSTEAAPPPEEVSVAMEMDHILQRLMKLTGVTDPEEVFDRFQAQRETSKRLNYLQRTTEEEKLQLEKAQNSLMLELEAFKLASVKDNDEAQDQINELKKSIQHEMEEQEVLSKKLEDVDKLLMDIKELLYELCKLLDVIPDPPVPEWTAEARDVQHIVQVLMARYGTAATRAADIRARRGDDITMPSNPPSRGTSMAMSTHNTPRETDVPAPTYKELLDKEPVRPPPSEDEEDIPSRSFLKRQAQLILDTKSRRKGFKPPYPRK